MMMTTTMDVRLTTVANDDEDDNDAYGDDGMIINANINNEEGN